MSLIYKGIPFGVVSVQALFKQQYYCDFIGTTSLSYIEDVCIEDCLKIHVLIPWLKSYCSLFHDGTRMLGLGIALEMCVFGYHILLICPF